MTPHYVVTGASGQIGRLVADRLAATGNEVRGLSRSRPKLEYDWSWMSADLAEPESLRRALDGARGALLVCADGPDQVRLEANFIDAAKTAGVQHIVKISAYLAGMPKPTSFGRLHAQIEAHLVRSGMAHTILRPAFYMQTLSLFRQDIAKGRLVMPVRHGCTAFIDARDVAACAAVALADAKHQGRNYALTGPESLTPGQVASALAIALGRGVRHVAVPALVARLVLPVTSGRGWWWSQQVVELCRAIERGEEAQTTGDVERLLKRKATTLQDCLSTGAIELE